jgi:hypothetical protein
MITASINCSFSAYTAVTASATMGFEAGQPYNDVITLASDPWTSMYPG